MTFFNVLLFYLCENNNKGIDDLFIFGIDENQRKI